MDPCEDPSASRTKLCQGIAQGKAKLAALAVAIAAAVNEVLDATTPFVDATRLLFGRETDGSTLTAGGAGLAAVGVFGGPVAEKAGDGVRLWKKLANEELFSEAKAGVGAVIAGAGKNKKIEDIQRLVAQHGGAEGEWAKLTTRTVTAPDGVKFSIHWYENLQTGVRTEFKTKIGD